MTREQRIQQLTEQVIRDTKVLTETDIYPPREFYIERIKSYREHIAQLKEEDSDHDNDNDNDNDTHEDNNNDNDSS